MKYLIIIGLISVSMMSNSCNDANVLETIETYKAPKINLKYGESYDNKLKNNSPLPQKLTDVLVYDVWLTLTRTLGFKGISPSSVTKDEVMQGLIYYKNNQWESVIGLRPYTNSEFIKTLSQKDLEVLAKNIVLHLKKFGVWKNPITSTPSIEQIDISDTLPSSSSQ
jgi:hypothetical protein